MRLRNYNAPHFVIYFDVFSLSDLITRNVEIRTLTAVKHNSLRTNLKKIQMAMHFYHYDKSDNITSIIPDNLIVEGVSLKDMYGNR